MIRVLDKVFIYINKNDEYEKIKMYEEFYVFINNIRDLFFELENSFEY